MNLAFIDWTKLFCCVGPSKRLQREITKLIFVKIRNYFILFTNVGIEKLCRKFQRISHFHVHYLEVTFIIFIDQFCNVHYKN
jgi:hypothetical protein